MAKPITKDRIIDRLSRKHSISKKKIEKVVNSQFKFVANTMKEGKFESVRLRFWGKFDVDPYRLQKIQEKSNGKSK